MQQNFCFTIFQGVITLTISLPSFSGTKEYKSLKYLKRDLVALGVPNEEVNDLIQTLKVLR